MKPYRSLLFVPGNRERMLEKAPTTAADALLVDLEDAVPIEEKDSARERVAEYVASPTGKDVFVRINALEEPYWADDIAGLVQPGLAGLFIPKVEDLDRLDTALEAIAQAERERGVEAGAGAVVCMIETALGARLAYDIAARDDRVRSLCFASGENGDMQTDLGCDWSHEGTEMLYARSKMLLDARAAGVAYPLDGVYSDVYNEKGLVADTELSKRLGYKGRTIIHPSHIEPVNRIYTPDPEQVAYCKGLIEALDAAHAEGKGSVTYEGKMIDYAMARWARQIVERAEFLAELNGGGEQRHRTSGGMETNA